jgi:L-fuconolactonase
MDWMRRCRNLVISPPEFHVLAFVSIMVLTKGEQSSRAAEAALEPGLPICDPHHHLWERPDNPYLEGDFLHDVSTGHNVVSTVAVECGAWYRGSGPEELKPLGETERLEGIARSRPADLRSPTAIASAIVAYADLTLGEAVRSVLDAHLEASPARLRGIRCSTQWDDTGTARSVERSGMLLEPSFRKGVACLGRADLSFEAWLAARSAHCPRSYRRAAGRWAVCW